MGYSEINKLKFLPLKDLPLLDVELRLKKYKRILQSELKAQGVFFEFHVWVSDDWFCPDGVPGFALPFYLFNPLLMDIQKKEMGFIEGRTDREILKLMRHELGHAIDNAFGLRKVLARVECFGSSLVAYPKTYSPKKYSRRFVNYLGDNYAQSHPDEDFAETFAYWLDPEKKWKNKKLSPVVKAKLQLVDQLMGELKSKKRVLKNQFCVDSIFKNSKTLANHYKDLKNQRKLRLITTDIKIKANNNKNSIYDNSKKKNKNTPRPSLQTTQSQNNFSVLQQRKEEVASQVSRALGFPKYKVKQSIEILIEQQKKQGIYPTHLLEKRLNFYVKKNFLHLHKTNQLKYFL